MAKTFSLCPYVPVQEALSRDQVPGTFHGHSRWPVHGCFEGESQWTQKTGPQGAETDLSPLPTPRHQSAENLQSIKPISSSVAFWGAASCLVMKFHSLVACLLVEDSNKSQRKGLF